MAKRQTATSKKSAGQKTATTATAGYSGTPLVKKLGIKADTTLTLLGEPAGFISTLGNLPDNVKIRKTAKGHRDLTVWFPRNVAELKRRIKALADGVEDGGLWIAWPKKSAGVETDLSDSVVRSTGLAHGIVDYKVCVIDETYSGLKFATRKTKG